MGPNKKINVKDRLSDGEIDLSMSDLDDVPIKEIAVLKKAYALDISNNRLSTLPKTFATLTHITKLDLSKNELQELPENFGDLMKLSYIDLYQNKLQHLPLSFSKLKSLKWLDLKDNPLVPTIAKVAGPCLDAKQCQTCAKSVVKFFEQLQEKVDLELESRNKERQKQLEINHQKHQEEKKNKKKEKSKEKKKIAQAADKVVEPKKFANNKSLKNKKDKASKTSSIGCLAKLIMILLALSSIVLFISTSIEVEHTRDIELFIKNIYSLGVAKLPLSYQGYGIKLGYVVKQYHEKTGNLTLGVIEFLSKSEDWNNFCIAFKSLLNNGINQIQELYTTVFTQKE